VTDVAIAVALLSVSVGTLGLVAATAWRMWSGRNGDSVLARVKRLEKQVDLLVQTLIGNNR
jgi:hypothetical protein